MTSLLAFNSTDNRYEALQVNATGNLKCDIGTSTFTVDCNNTQVEVSNFPATTSVSGTVAVSSVSGNVAVTKAPLKATFTLFNAQSITTQTTSSAIDVSAYTHVNIVAEGTTAGTNGNSSTYDIELSYDNSTYFRASDKVYASQNVGATTKRSGNVLLQLGGVKYIKLTTYDTETLTAHAYALQ